MRFGIFVPQGWRMDLVGIAPEHQWGVMRDLAQRVDAEEALESLWVYDHVHTVPEPSEEACHEAWSLMSAFAAVTGRVRLGQMCSCMSYRNPAYLAKVAATVDIVSEGRLEMGIGAGWYEHEWRAYGYGFPSAGERIAMLDEGVQIFKQLWTNGVATLDGKHYQVDGAQLAPLPLQVDGPPLWIAGGGERKTLRIAAEHAQYTNFDGTPEVFAHKSQVLRLTEVALDVESEGVLGAAVRAAAPYLEAAVAERTVIDLKPFAANARKSIQAAIAEFRGAGNGVRVDASVADLRVVDIAFDATTLRVIAEADGVAKVSVTSLPK